MSDAAVDLFQKRIDKIAATPEAQRLRQDICAAADAYCEVFERHGLKLHISFGRDTQPPPNSNNVVRIIPWDKARDAGGGSGNAA